MQVILQNNPNLLLLFKGSGISDIKLKKLVMLETEPKHLQSCMWVFSNHSTIWSRGKKKNQPRLSFQSTSIHIDL